MFYGQIEFNPIISGHYENVVDAIDIEPVCLRAFGWRIVAVLLIFMILHDSPTFAVIWPSVVVWLLTYIAQTLCQDWNDR